MCFRKCSYPDPVDVIVFNGLYLLFSNTVQHLGHLVSFDLSDREGIIRVTEDVNRKANTVMCTFSYADLFVLTFLFKAYCFSLYGCTLWSLSSRALSHLQVAINNVLRRIWHLPPYSHSYIYCFLHSWNFIFTKHHFTSV